MAVRAVDVYVAFQWNGTDWTDETDNLISASGTLEMTPPGESYLSGKQIIQQATVTLANKDLRYSIENNASPIFSFIENGLLYQRRCRIQFKDSVESDFVTVFTGYIKLPTYDYLRNRVTFQVWDVGEILKKKFSTTMLVDYLEHDVVIHYLELAGLVDGVDFISPTYAAANSLTETIEYSNAPVPFSWLDDEPVFNEIVDLAQSRGSRVYVDREGMIHYEQQRFWLTQGNTPEVMDGTKLAEFNVAYDDKAFYDAITVEYSERNAGGGPEELWKLQKPKVILPGQVEEIVARFRYPAIALTTPAANDTYFVTDLAGNDVSGSVTITLDPVYAQQATININNSTGGAIMLSQMSITGIAIHGLPAEQYTVESETPLYGRRIDVRGNPYLQTRLQAQVAGDFLAWWYGTLKLIFPLNGIRGNPIRGLGWHVDVQWYDRTNDATYSIPAIIVRTQWRINIDPTTRAISYVQDMTALQDVFASGAEYFIIGTSTLGGPTLLWY